MALWFMRNFSPLYSVLLLEMMMMVCVIEDLTLVKGKKILFEVHEVLFMDSDDAEKKCVFATKPLEGPAGQVLKICSHHRRAE